METAVRAAFIAVTNRFKPKQLPIQHYPIVLFVCVCELFLCLFVVLPSMNFDVIDVGLSIQIPFL